MEQWLTLALREYAHFAIGIAFLIGVLTSIAPCSILTLPLLAGSALSLSQGLNEKQKRTFIVKYSVLFVLGLVVSFSILMLLVSKLGWMLSVAPFWAYALASCVTFMILLYALGFVEGVDKERVTRHFLPWKLLGAVFIGLIFGLVSTPCASAPLAAIITVAHSSGWIYSYGLVFSFALGHGLLLLAAGTSLALTQKIVSSKALHGLSRVLNALFMFLLAGIGVYFGYQAYVLF